MKKSFRFMAGICAAAALTVSAFAADRKQHQDGLEGPGGGNAGQASFSKDRQTPPLLYAVPTLDSNDVDVLEIRIVQGKHPLVRETVVLPVDRAANAVVDVLYTHPQELKKYRDLEAATPGALRFIVTSAGRVLTHAPFAEIEAASAALSVDNAVGEIHEIAVSAAPKTRVVANGVTKDPYCMQRCDSDLDMCLNYWCDPRGDSCNQCWTWYNDCVMTCPDVCTDPKSVTTYTTRTAVSVTKYGSSCRTGYAGATYWDDLTVLYRHDTYERTTNCDGSYTDRWTGSYDQYVNCWSNSGRSCSFPVGSPPYPRC